MEREESFEINHNPSFHFNGLVGLAWLGRVGLAWVGLGWVWVLSVVSWVLGMELRSGPAWQELLELSLFPGPDCMKENMVYQNQSSEFCLGVFGFALFIYICGVHVCRGACGARVSGCMRCTCEIGRAHV